jgi:uncharacterized protein
MSVETLEAAWTLLFPDGLPREGTSIRLGSGEPLLAFDMLEKLAALIERTGGAASDNRPAVFLTTNATCASRNVRDWLVASGWHVKISLDGPRRVHDRWRVTGSGRGTFTVVGDAVADLVSRMPDRLSVTAVLCRGSDPFAVFRAIADLGVRRIELVPVAHDDASVVPAPRDVARYERFVEAHARRCRRGEAVPSLVRFDTCVRRAMGYDGSRVACGAGRTFLGVASNGDLYPCFRFLGVERYRLGGLPGGLDARAAAAFNEGAGRPFDRRTPCRRCPAAPLCGGPCFAVAELFGQPPGRPLAVQCAYARANARWAVWLVDQLRSRGPARLLPFLPGAAADLLPPE